MRWKIFAVFIVFGQVEVLYSWFNGSTPATVPNFTSLAFFLAVTVATVSYAFNLSVLSPRFWRTFSWIYLAYFVVWFPWFVTTQLLPIYKPHPTMWVTITFVAILCIIAVLGPIQWIVLYRYGQGKTVRDR